ncbi:MAG: arylamine N-acetyltransferase [Solirubrobacterales bacterium]
MPDLDAVLERIGLDTAPAPTLAGLDTLQRAFVTHVPFEVLAIHLSELEPLDLERVAQRVLTGGRGGYCFELNGLFAWLLEQLGFAVERRESVVGPREATAAGLTNHLGLVVTATDAGPRLAEVGFGHGPLRSVPLAAGRHGSPFAWTLHAEPGGGWYWEAPELVSSPGIRIGTGRWTTPRSPRTTCTSPACPTEVRRNPRGQRPDADRLVSLRARTLSVVAPGRREQRVLEDAGDLADTLLTTFGIDADVLGERRIQRLWDCACAQHEAWARAT